MKTLTISTALLFVLSVGAMLTTPIPTLAAEPVYVLKTASQESAPKYVIGTGSSRSGIAVDIIRAVEGLDPRLKFTGLEYYQPFARIVAELELGKRLFEEVGRHRKSKD